VALFIERRTTMLVTVNGVEKEVAVKKQGSIWICRVGNAKVYWREKYVTPYVILHGKSLTEINRLKPAIIAYLREYKLALSIEKKVPPMSFEGEGKITEYKYNPGESKDNYVSAVPKWLRDVKIKQICSGPIRTFTRGIKIPQEYKDMAKKYMPYCCNCAHRVNCDMPCLTPDVNSKETILEGIEREEFNMAKFYGVKVGRNTGVFETWAACEDAVKGYPGAQYKGFTGRGAAEVYAGITPKEEVAPQSTVNSKVVTIYTDGACSGNPGPGGWGCILMLGEYKKEHSGYIPAATNNKMELTAAIKGLQHLTRPCTVELYTDSQYLINGIDQWISGWKAKGWKTCDGKPVKNQELWIELDKLASIHKIKWNYVKGHASNKYNNRCDELATSAIKNRGPIDVK
jgi:ribonuclease HI